MATTDGIGALTVLALAGRSGQVTTKQMLERQS
jgi:hypothetical protein